MPPVWRAVELWAAVHPLCQQPSLRNLAKHFHLVKDLVISYTNLVYLVKSTASADISRLKALRLHERHQPGITALEEDTLVFFILRYKAAVTEVDCLHGKSWKAESALKA